MKNRCHLLFKLKTDSHFAAKPCMSFFLKKSATFQTQHCCKFQSVGSMAVNAQVPDVII